MARVCAYMRARVRDRMPSLQPKAKDRGPCRPDRRPCNAKHSCLYARNATHVSAHPWCRWARLRAWRMCADAVVQSVNNDSPMGGWLNYPRNMLKREQILLNVKNRLRFSKSVRVKGALSSGNRHPSKRNRHLGNDLSQPMINFGT